MGSPTRVAIAGAAGKMGRALVEACVQNETVMLAVATERALLATYHDAGPTNRADDALTRETLVRVMAHG